MKKKKDSKKKKPKKSESKEKKQETELEEEIEKAEKAIAHRLRETLNEKEIQEEQDFFEEPVRQIPIQSETSAPVLERIIQRETPIDNSIPIEQPREREGEANERRIDYSAQNQPNYGFQRNTPEENEEKKYESTFVPPVLSRRGELDAIRPEFLHSPTETWTPARGNNNEIIESEFIEQETKLPFEEQKKYKRFKLR